MIQRIILHNFQNHADTVLELSEGVNIIAGPSDNGKSSIIRALRWVILNKPQGAGFIRNGEKECSVTIITDEHEVCRIRTAKDNTYLIDGVEFKAMRGNVPEEIQNVLDIGPANLQSQHDPYYLLNLSPGDVARHLNSIAGLSVIDESTKRAASLIADTNNKIKMYTSAVESAEASLDQYKNLDAIASLINRIGRVYQNQQQRATAVTGIMAIQKAACEHQAALLLANTLLTARPHVEALKVAVSSIEDKRQKAISLSRIIHDHGVTRTNALRFGNTLQQADSIIALRDATEAFADKRTDVQSLMQTCSDIDKTNRNIQHLEDMIKADTQRAQVLRGTIKVCPTCGTVLAADKAE